MGEKGAKETQDAAEIAEVLVAEFGSLGPVEAKKMFGGFGIFSDAVMFALVDSQGTAYLRADPQATVAFTDEGSAKHGRMPYWQIPGRVLADPELLAGWGRTALLVAQAAKK
ncbi:MAG: TfoX/Sxy family protein [Actinomycetia bacterium]|nr:TfoX/Sxy family protein [Actinomycetes bacterium]